MRVLKVWWADSTHQLNHAFVTDMMFFGCYGITVLHICTLSPFGNLQMASPALGLAVLCAATKTLQQVALTPFVCDWLHIHLAQAGKLIGTYTVPCASWVAGEHVPPQLWASIHLFTSWLLLCSVWFTLCEKLPGLISKPFPNFQQCIYDLFSPRRADLKPGLFYHISTWTSWSQRVAMSPGCESREQ